MKNVKLYFLVLALLLALPVFAQSAAPQDPNASAATPSQQQGPEAVPALPPHNKSASASEENRIVHEVRHELVMQTRYTLWDWLAFRVNGNTVELLGYANSTGLKRDAVDSVKHIEGVEKVIDNIQELPPSPMDDRIRHQVAHAIFNWDGLSRYAWSAVPSIHIVVDKGRVRLLGIVDNQTDKNMAGLRANGVPGVFQVTNDLQVVKP